MLSMNTSLNAIEADLIRDEGIRSKPYKDTLGYLTIGVGHNLDASGLCEEAIMAQLRFDLEVVRGDLDRSLAWWSSQPEAAQRVLMNLAFNLGVAKLLSFTHTLLAIKVKQYDVAAAHLLNSLYAKQVGERANRLAKLLREAV